MLKNDLKNNLILIWLIIFFTFCFAVILYIRIEQTKIGYFIINHYKQVQELQEKNRTLDLEIAMMTRPDRLHKILNNLGYYAPRHDQIYKILPQGK